jgi:hypothetical protein
MYNFCMNESGPGNRGNPQPDVGKQKKDTPEARKSLIDAAFIMLAFISAAALVVGETQDEKKPGITVSEPREPKKSPERSLPAAEASLQEANQKIHLLMKDMRSPEVRNRIAVLNPEKSLKETCRAISNWMIKNNGDLDLVWRHLNERRSSWTPELKADFDALLRDMENVPGAARNWNDMYARTHKRLVENNPLSCGFGVWIASFKTNSREVQERGFGFAERVRIFIEHETTHADSDVQKRGAESANAIVRVLESMMQK